MFLVYDTGLFGFGDNIDGLQIVANDEVKLLSKIV